MRATSVIWLICFTAALSSSTQAQPPGNWNKVDTVTAGQCNDLNPALVHNAVTYTQGDFLWTVFERHTATESQIAAAKFSQSITAWDSSVVILSSRPAGEEQKYPDIADVSYFDGTRYRVLSLAAWQVREENRWKIYYATFADGDPAWSAASLLVADSLDNTGVQVRFIRDTSFIITWKRKNTIMTTVKSPAARGPVETVAVSSTDSLAYDIHVDYGRSGILWTTKVDGKMTPVYRSITTYPQVQFATPETLYLPFPCYAPHLGITWMAAPSILFESPNAGMWDVFYALRWYTPVGSLTDDPLSENRNARSFNLPVITKQARGRLNGFTSPFGTIVYEKIRGNDSSLVFINGPYADTVRTQGHNRNALVGSKPFINQPGLNVLVVWESNRSGWSHIYSRIVRVFYDGIDDTPQPGSPFALLQNYPNPFNPVTTIRYAVPERSHVTLTVFNNLAQRVAVVVNENQEAGVHEVRFDGTGLASGVYFYRIEAGRFTGTRKLLLVR